MSSALERNYAEAGQGLVRPQLAPLGQDFDEWITVRSKEWQQEACVQIRRYQSRECNDGISMDTSYECWRRVKIKPFTDRFYDKKDDMRHGLIGAAAFELETFVGGTERYAMQFCWLHPFYRGKGLLRKAWPDLNEKFGDFWVSQPRSRAMQAFLASLGYVDPM